jgi:hypothetical protein
MDTGYIAEGISIGGIGSFAYKDSLFYSEVTGTKPPTDADNTGSNTAANTNAVAGTAATTVRDNAAMGNSAKSVTNNWTRPGQTLIDGNKIFTGDAYVDTLQIKGQAVTFPRGTQAGNSVALNSSGVNILSLTITASGAPLIITGSASIVGVGNDSNGSAYGSLALYRGGTALFGPVGVASTHVATTGGPSGSTYALAGGGSIQVYIPAGVTGTYYLKGYGQAPGNNPIATQRSLTIMEAKR